MATPFITDYIKQVRGEKKIDEGMVRQIFNEIDEDGDQTLDQCELFNFIKRQDFKDPNAPSDQLKVKTLSGASALTPRNYSSDIKANSIYDAVMIKLRIAQKEMGAIEMEILPKSKCTAYEEDGGNVYEGQRDMHKHKHGFGIKKFQDTSIYVGYWEDN